MGVYRRHGDEEWGESVAELVQECQHAYHGVDYVLWLLYEDIVFVYYIM